MELSLGKWPPQSRARCRINSLARGDLTCTPPHRRSRTDHRAKQPTDDDRHLESPAACPSCNQQPPALYTRNNSHREYHRAQRGTGTCLCSHAPAGGSTCLPPPGAAIGPSRCLLPPIPKTNAPRPYSGPGIMCESCARGSSCLSWLGAGRLLNRGTYGGCGRVSGCF